MRKKSSILSDVSLEMLSIDADNDDGGKASGGPSHSKDHTSNAKNRSPSIRSEAHWRDSGHSTLVADMNMSNNTVNPHRGCSKVGILLFDDGLREQTPPARPRYLFQHYRRRTR